MGGCRTPASFQIKIEIGTCIVYVECNEVYNLRIKIYKSVSVTEERGKGRYLLIITIGQSKTMGLPVYEEALVILN